MQMIRQHHKGVDGKRSLIAGSGDGEAQMVDMLGQQAGAALIERHGEEDAGPGDPDSAIG